MHVVGDGERVRHCDQCDLNVYNLSALTADEAEVLLRAHEGRRLCGTFYRREDGTVLTRDCPVGLALVRARLARTVARMSAAAGLLVTTVIILGAKSGGEPVRLRQMDPFAKLVAWLNPAVPLPLPMAGKVSMLAGAMAYQPPPPLPPAPPAKKSPSKRPNIQRGAKK